jgi:hypothetical protein
MLCGAADTHLVQAQFAKVVNDLGGEPMHYLSGQIHYLNMVSASWDRNSKSTVASADLCVFVILERYGEITWSTELQEALNNGKPFIILCRDDTYKAYLTLKRDVDVLTAIKDPDKRHLIEILTEMESDRQLTIVQFSMETFPEILRREAAKLFQYAVTLLAQRFKRESLAKLLQSPDALTPGDLVAAEEIALDEFEEKAWRKSAVKALAQRGSASSDTTIALIRSPEQGVQRLAFDLLPQLHRPRPPDPDFLDDCVAVANRSDDLGVARRLVPALFDIDVRAAVHALRGLELAEVVSRWRLAALLVEHEAEYTGAHVRDEVVELLIKCLRDSKDPSWQTKARECIARLQAKGDSTELMR